MRTMDGLRQPQPRHQRRRDGHRRRHPDRRGIADVRKRPAERGTDDESETEGRPKEAVALARSCSLRDVGDVGARRRDVPARQTVHDARRKEHREALGQRQHHEAHGRADQAEDEHRPAAPAIRQIAEERRGDQLREGKRREEQTDGGGDAPKLLGIERQERNDDPEADQIDEDGDENNEEGPGQWKYWLLLISRPTPRNSRSRVIITGSTGTSSWWLERRVEQRQSVKTSMPVRTRPKTA